MKIYRIILLLLVPVLLGAGGVSTRAQETPSVSTPQLRIWTSPNCRKASRHLFLTDSYILNFADGSSEILRLAPDQGDDVIRIRGIKQPYDLKLLDNQLMRRTVPLFIPIDQPEDYDPFVAEQAQLIPYEACGDTFADLPAFDPEGLKFLQTLVKIDTACGSTTITENPECQNEIFSFFDQNKNKALEVAELGHAYRALVFIGASTGCKLSLYFTEKTKENAPVFAEKVIAIADGDESQSLSLEELNQAWLPLRKEKLFSDFEDVARNTSFILPYIPAGPLLAGCSCQLELTPDTLPAVTNTKQD